MNRRGFLVGVGSALVIGTAPAVAQSAPPSAGQWQVTRWIVKEFDFGRDVGVCAEVTHSVTGHRLRSAVRFRGLRSVDLAERMRRCEEFGREILGDELVKLNRGEPSSFAGDPHRVLEGHEPHRMVLRG